MQNAATPERLTAVERPCFGDCYQVEMTDRIELQERRETACEGHYEPWREEHETVLNESQWIPAKILTQLINHVGSLRAEASSKKTRLALISEIEDFFKEQCVGGEVVFGPHKRFPENQHVRCDDEFWKTHFDQIIKCLLCGGISDVDRDFFLEQKLATVMSWAEAAAVSRDSFENSNNLRWRISRPGLPLSPLGKQQQVLKLQKALLDLRVFKRDFNNLIARIESRVHQALHAVDNSE